MIRLILTDDHTIFRQSLRFLLDLEADIEVLGEASNGESALALVRELAPALVLMDIDMTGINGVEATRRITSEYPHVRVLALSAHLDRRFVVQMLAAGAQGFVNKSAGREDLLRGIRSVAAGHRYLCQDIAAMLLNAPEGNSASSRLGRRETDVLKRIADGQTSAEIGGALYIAPGTVDVHRRNIMRKLDLHNIAELTKYALREGLVTF